MRLVIVCCWLLIFPVIGNADAKEIQISYQGLKLNSYLVLAANKNIEDGMILMTHAGLAHGRMETMSYIQQLFKEHGYSTLAITLSLGLDDRHGMLDCKATHKHHYRDAADEIGAWLEWLKQQGTRQVILFGHSRGGAQTALYSANNNNPLVKAVVLLAPDTQATNDAAAYQRRHDRPLAPVLVKAKQLVAVGKSKALLKNTGILYCRDTSVTAGTIVSYYGDDPELDTPYLVPRIKQLTMIVIAGEDEAVVGHKSKFLPLAKTDNVQVIMIDGAGHFFRDLFADEAVEAIVEFLGSIH